MSYAVRRPLYRSEIGTALCVLTNNTNLDAVRRCEHMRSFAIAKRNVVAQSRI